MSGSTLLSAKVDIDTTDAFRLAGKPWHSLSQDDTARVIVLQHVKGLLYPAVRNPLQPGECLVGPVTMTA